MAGDCCASLQLLRSWGRKWTPPEALKLLPLPLYPLTASRSLGYGGCWLLSFPLIPALGWDCLSPCGLTAHGKAESQEHGNSVKGKGSTAFPRQGETKAEKMSNCNLKIMLQSSHFLCQPCFKLLPSLYWLKPGPQGLERWYSG